MQAKWEHPSEEDLERYAMGLLAEADVEAFEEHLLICPACQDQLAQTDEFVKAMRAAAQRLRGRNEPSQSKAPTGGLSALLTPSRLAWAAAAVALLAVVIWSTGLWRPGRPANVAPVAVLLQTSRGEAETGGVTAPAGRSLLLEADSSGLPAAAQWRIEIVDERGRPVRSSPATLEGERVRLTLREGLGRGRYWVRLYAGGSETPLQEYALRVD